jgi:hypothetical protein
VDDRSAEIRDAVLQRLAQGEDSRFGESYLPMATARAITARLTDVWEALWGLMGDGLIFLDPAGQSQSSSWDNWRWQLTDAGRQTATEGTWEPHDPARFLARLRDRSPGLADEAIAYFEEALPAFNARCYLASSVMLGVAAEQVFGRLAAAFVGAHPSETDRLKRLLSDSSSHYRRFDEFRKRLEPIRATVPEGLADAITLDAVADLLRVTRNAAGHPTGQQVDEEVAYTHLVMAAMLLAKMTELAEHFEQQAAHTRSP